MPISRKTYAKNEVTSWPIPNYWDAIAISLVLGLIVILGYGAHSMVGVYSLTETAPISLHPIWLPYYGLRTVLRMLMALILALFVTFIVGTWAAKSRAAERIIIPTVDILQSVPILGFLAITVTGFMALFPGSLLGPECAAIFAIFTAQVWNMILSFYQSLSTVPRDLQEASLMLQLSAWQRFWRVEVPFAMPGLLWNAMISMSGSWVFLVAAEAISVANHQILLPGVGSYMTTAIRQMNGHALTYAIITMLVVITLYDQLLFRPLGAWAEKFKMQGKADEWDAPSSWVFHLFQRAHFLRFIARYLSVGFDSIVNWRLLRQRPSHRVSAKKPRVNRVFRSFWIIALIVVVAACVYLFLDFILSAVNAREVLRVFYLGFLTALRVVVVILISSLVWVPVGVWIGFRPRVSRIMQPIAQFLAAFPINLLFPIAVMAIVGWRLNVNIWVSPLMVLGTQWYILFNVIAGATVVPQNLREVVGTLNMKGWLWWKRFILPAIFPYYITGAITAAGGAWNVSIIAEVIQWGHTQLDALGLGAYIFEASKVGDFRRLSLGIMVMALYVLILNRVMWRPLYNFSQERFQG